jgi:hypothetical protein
MKTKIMIFKTGRKLKDECWFLNKEKPEVANEFTCLGIKLENTAEGTEQKSEFITKIKQCLVAIDTYVVRATKVQVNIRDDT